MAKQKTPTELRAENRLLRRGHISTSIASVLNTACKYGFLAYAARQIYLSIDSLAGETTLATFIVEFFGNVSVNKWLAYTFGGGGIVYGWFERRARRKNLKRLGPRNKQLEAAIDPNRSSSKLTDKGDPPPKGEV